MLKFALHKELAAVKRTYAGVWIKMSIIWFRVKHGKTWVKEQLILIY